MKKLLFMFVTIFFVTTSVNAQVTKPGHNKNNQKKSMSCYVMKDGKIYHSMAGKDVLMQKEVTLKNGETIMSDGHVKMKDGKEMMLKNDECIDAMGNFHESHKDHHKKA